MADLGPGLGGERRPAPGEERGEGPERPARAAASVILLRDGLDGPEVLLVERNPAQRFMGGAWVFPGGGVDPGEEAADTGVRELEEEASIALGGVDGLVAYSRWITPQEVKIRFDTYFFVARAPEAPSPGRTDRSALAPSGDARRMRWPSTVAAGSSSSSPPSATSRSSRRSTRWRSAWPARGCAR